MKRFFWIKHLFLVIAIILLFDWSYLVNGIDDDETWKYPDYVPPKMISTQMRHRLIYFRIQSMQKNNETVVKGTVSTQNSINKEPDNPIFDREQTLPEIKTTTQAPIPLFLPLPITNLSTKTMSTPLITTTRPFKPADLLMVSPKPITYELTSTAPTPLPTKSSGSLCLPKMPTKFSSIAGERDIGHSPPIWLALLPKSQRRISQNYNQYLSKNFSYGLPIGNMKANVGDDTIEPFLRRHKRSYSYNYGENISETIVNYKSKHFTKESSRFDRSPRFPILNQQVVPLSQSLNKVLLSPVLDEKLQLQIVHPNSPNEKDWVIAAGNESAVDGVLSISLAYAGRLASMGFYHNSYGEIQYYAIMHRFMGPVFLKPDPISLTELMKMAKENEELDLGLTQLCGQDDGEGKILFSTYWERIPGVSFRIWFPGSKEAETQRNSFEEEGFRLISICGYSSKGEARFVGIWQKPVTRVVPYEAHFGITLRECLSLDEQMRAKDFVATQFRVFNNGQDVLCAAIWEHVPGKKHFIEISDNLRQMHRKHMMVRLRLPRQISHFVDVLTKRVKFVVLWSNLHSFRYPDPPDIWLNKAIPVTYLSGTQRQLDPAQLDFVSKRVERFMRELDIPGLSVAISRDEQLKFAAGFGYGNVRRRELVSPLHQFRIGSISKPITAAAILILVERQKLKLNQFVFGGPESIFGSKFAKKHQYGRYITEITVRNLLEHTSGGWNNVDSDPAWLEPGKSTEKLIEKVIHQQPLITKPGKVWIYSNFGYQLLGYIIEQLSGQSYEAFVKENIWLSVGVKDIQIARPTLSEKSSREVLYYMSGNKVGFNPYEMLPPERTGPWGGWIASPIELLRLMSRIDGFKKKPDILSDTSIREWARPTLASNLTYGLGWSLNIMGFNGWQHDGRMPGSASMLVRLDNGLEMAVVVNKEYSERDFFHELGYILHHIGNNCDWWKDSRIDLFKDESIITK